jgi:ABC-type methionine transport system ATPase subunit
MIALRDVQKVYRQGESEVRALAGVSLEIAAGEHNGLPTRRAQE